MKKTLILILIIATTGIVFAQNAAQQRVDHFNIAKSGLAIKGYDPVSYHKGKASKGNDQIAVTYNGLQYRFVSEANRSKFQSNPDRFEPAYGGWCAWAMLEGDKIDINPKRYKIINGKTYLFYDGFFGNTLKKWNEKAEKETEAELLQAADAHWQKLTQ